MGVRAFGAGEVVVRKSNVEQWLKALEDGSQDLQIFSPRRDDLCWDSEERIFRCDGEIRTSE